MSLAFQDQAVCSGVDWRLFFKQEFQDLAAEWCMECPVRHECHEYAATHEPDIYGTWAGVWYPGPYPEHDDE